VKTKSLWKGALLSVGALALLALILSLSSTEGAKGAAEEDTLTYTVKKGDLVVDILEIGSIEASASQDIKSQVEGRTTVISIVPEGTILTDEDVKNGKVLVELDSAELRQRETQQQITVQSALANLTDASASYEIQKKQNESNLKQGELKLKFGRMDMDKYLGEQATAKFLAGQVDLLALVEQEDLGGEALQKRRNLGSDIELAQEDIARASEKLDWTVKLYKKGYVTRNEMQVDELALKRQGIQLQKAFTALDLFKRYEFPKEAERLRSDFEEASRELERIIAKNNSELSKADVRLNTNQSTYRQQYEQLQKIQEQIKNCVIRATQPGLVVYAGSDQPWRNDRIEEGAEIRERQDILKIPNTTTMLVKAQVHESVIARVQEGQRVLITIDAMPERQFEGKVSKVGILPDNSNRWWNPNRKVYLTDISIEGNHPDLKPGMSAQVRIVINELKDVTMVPIQAVTALGDETVCFVKGLGGADKRVVQTGDYNDKFIEIRDGLKEGEKVVLNPSDLKKDLKPTLAMQKDAILSGPKLENGEAPAGGDHEKAEAKPAPEGAGAKPPVSPEGQPGGGEQGR